MAGRQALRDGCAVTALGEREQLSPVLNGGGIGFVALAWLAAEYEFVVGHFKRPQ